MNDMTELVAGNREVIRSVATGRPDAYMIPLGIVRIREGFNDARKADPDYPAHVREIADSMKANGWLRHKPLVGVITPEGLAVPSDGHSRYEAALLANSEGAGIEQIPFMPEHKGTNEDDRIFGLILNNNGKRLTPMGEAIVIKQLIGRGIAEKEIARRLGYSITTVQKALTLIAAPTPIRDMVLAGEVSATTAIKAIKEHGAQAVGQLQEAKETAAAAGKTRITGKHLGEPKPKKPHVDTVRLDFLIETGARVEKVSDEPQYAVVDKNGNPTFQAGNPRNAIDAAIEYTNQSNKDATE
ncbi:TPA: ParB/RepB/Spo0J family partition protein [Burkholderia vietnamiensis]|uniref:ParB/RepB/Spo0J family partition protein n=1 Tax=Burkholderia vietnamiensis TaxID=60552 RepID=UPI001588A49D|nr:ParB/RepB/Spo0J family partition protein [Burkholderia vietnamiensis]HDR9003005.1 ParB/RepB/Spo0J family partition protein [Burkholderia vietnamiensis]HDR9006951.1 ParB/RepB/Spo0J family partition protein [Burkholderia vietnamiensis]